MEIMEEHHEDFLNFTNLDSESDFDSDSDTHNHSDLPHRASMLRKITIKNLSDPEDLKSIAKDFCNFRRQKKNLRRLAIILGFYMMSVLFYWNVEGWNVLDCFYFTTTTVFAVGFGDFVPTTDTSRLFTCFIIILGLLVVFAELTSFIKGMLAFVHKQTKRILRKENKHRSGTPGEIEGLINDFHNNHCHVDSSTHAWKVTPRFRSILINVGVVFGYIFIGAIIFYYNEYYSGVSSFYLAIVTVSTVGFGDFRTGRALHDTTKVMMIFYIPGAFCVLSTCVANILIQYNEILAEQQRIVDCLKPVHYEELRKRIHASVGGIDKLEFLLIMLASNNSGINFKKDIKPWLDKYDELAVSGPLGMAGLDKLEEAEEKRIEHVERVLVSSHIGGSGLRKHLQRSITRSRALSTRDFRQACLEHASSPSSDLTLSAAAPPPARRLSTIASEDSTLAAAAAAATSEWMPPVDPVIPGSAGIDGDVELALSHDDIGVSRAVPSRFVSIDSDSDVDSHHYTWVDSP